jgi:beta-galactosidase
MPMPDRRALLLGAATLASSWAALPPLSAAGSPAATGDDLAPRQRLPFDFDWRFALGHAADVDRDFGFGRDQKTFAKQGQGVAAPAGAAFDDSTWQPVDLPHDWAVDLPFAESAPFAPPKDPQDGDPGAGHGYKAIGRRFPENSIGWYRKVFHLDKADENRRLTLEFDGVFRDATVIVNGYILARHESGYTPFSVDISNVVDTDSPNVLVVRVDASLGEGWFYEGAGIYRHVWLVKSDPVHIPQWGVWVRGETSGQVALETALSNRSDRDARLEVVSTIRDASGLAVAEARSTLDLPAHGDTTLAQTARIPAPRLWSLDDPHLYTVRTQIHRDGERLDVAVTTFGLRDIRFDARTGFYLNGQWMKIRGTNNHQDHAGVGVALPDTLHVWRVQQLKAMGANAWRCAHNPPSPALLDACDRLGMLVIDETRLMTSSPEGVSELETLIRRDRNHPSIMLWSIGNEETAQQGTARGLKIARDMRRTVKALDPTRPITAAMNHYQGYGITPALDVMGFNYHEADIEPFRKLYPDMPIIGTETASAVSTRGEYVRDDVKGYVRAYDLDAPSYAKTAEAWWTLYNSKPYLSGGLVWTGFDYRGEPTPFNRWPEISSHFGILDTCGFPKDIYYYYRAWWQAEPVLHLLPHWNWEGREDEDIPVWAYSNLDAVELFVNGRSCGRRPMARDSHAEWTVPYRQGEIAAYGYKGDKVVMKTSRRTAGPVAQVRLSCDRGDLKGDGRDVVLLKAEAFDAAGVPAPKADNLVHFEVEGPGAIIGVGNGNPTSLERDHAMERRLFNGLAQAILQARRGATGQIVVTARSENLPPYSIKLHITT